MLSWSSMLLAASMASGCNSSRSRVVAESSKPQAAAPSQPPAAQPAPAVVAVTMAEFESDFDDLFPSSAFLRARGLDEVVATSQGLVDGGPVGAASRITRRYDADGKLVFSEELSGRELVRTTRVTRIDATHKRESMEHAFWKTTTTTDETTDAAGRPLTRASERSTERFFYDNDKLTRVTREEGGNTLVKRFDHEGNRITRMTIEDHGAVILEETREYDAAGRETKRITKRGKDRPVEVGVTYDAKGNVSSLAIHEGGAPILRRTLRYQGEVLVEQRTESFVPAVGSAITTFAYRKRAP